jgi:hypothetical protein
MEAHTVGGVIRPGDRIMDIVPEGDVLMVNTTTSQPGDKVRVGHASANRMVVHNPPAASHQVSADV